MTTIAELLSAADRKRLAERLAELAEVERLARERGKQQPPPEPVPLCRPAGETSPRENDAMKTSRSRESGKSLASEPSA